MVRDFGDDGSVFMGRGMRSATIEAAALKRVDGAYERNVYRVLDLVDAYYGAGLTKRQALVDSICVLSATAYEMLTDDIFDVLEDADALPQVAKSEKTSVAKRRGTLLEQLALTLDQEYAPHLHALRYLEIFRHCMLHNAGIADAKLLERATALGDASMINVGQPLSLDMSAATSFLDSLQQLSFQVLRRADLLLQRD